MKRLSILPLLLASLPSAALDLTVGSGHFDTRASIDGMMSASIDLDITTLSLRQPATPIAGLPLHWSMRLELFQSAYANRVADFVSQPVRTDIPRLGGSIDDLANDFTAVPVPADYHVYGLDLNIGIGHGLLDTDRGSVRIGLNSGVTLPFLRTRNLATDANLLLDVLDTTTTEIQTLKLGPAMTASWQASPVLTLRGSWTYDRQWGRLDNELLASGIGIDGSYWQWDIGVELHSHDWPSGLRWLQNGHVVAGYRRSRWDFDSTTVRLPRASAVVPAMLDMAFTQETLYAGVGIEF